MLLLDPPSFRKFDGGAGFRYETPREITSSWFPVWPGYPVGLVKESRLFDAPSQDVDPEEAIDIAKE